MSRLAMTFARHCERSAAIHSPVIASEARQSMDRFVPRDDGSNVILCLKYLSVIDV
jgi:hypothetical protein